MAELLAVVLTFDGAVGSRSEIVDGEYTGRPGGPFTYREGKAEAVRQLAEAEGIDLSRSWAYSDSESDLPLLRAVGHPVAVNPDGTLARVAREEGWEILRFERLNRRLRYAGALVGAAALGGAGSLVARRVAGVSELTAEQEEIRSLARRFADEKIAPHAAEWDRNHTFPTDALLRPRATSGSWASASPRSTAGRAPTSSPTCWSWRSCRAVTPVSA